MTRERAGRERLVPVEVRLAAEVRAKEGPEPLAVLFLPFNCGAHSINRTRGKHFGTLAAGKEVAQQAALWAWCEADQPVLDVPVDVDVIRFGTLRMDDTGITESLKACRDTLCGARTTGQKGSRAVRGRMVVDDAPEWFRYRQVWQVTGGKWRANNSWAVLIFRPRPE